MEITDVQVFESGDDDRTRVHLSWKCEGVSYRMYESSRLLYRGKGRFRPLNATAKVNAPMVEAARAIAREQGLYEKAASDRKMLKANEAAARLAAVVLQHKRDAAELLYDALKNLLEKCDVFSHLCGPEMDAAHAAINAADGHADIPGGFEVEGEQQP